MARAIVKRIGAMTDWVDAGAITISATTTAPTKPTVVDNDKVWWRQEGDSIHVRMEYEQSASTGANSGSGMYLLQMPAGFQIDLTKVTADTRVVNGTATSTYASNCVGMFNHCESAGNDNTSVGPVVVYDADYVCCRFNSTTDAGGATTGGFGSSVFGLAESSQIYFTLDFVVPVTSLSVES